MAISFVCGCGKTLRAREELAGKKARCNQCSAVVTIPYPEPEPAPEYDLGPGAAAGAVGPDDPYEIEPPARPGPAMTFRPAAGRDPEPERAAPRAAVPNPRSAPEADPVGGRSSLLEYAHLLLAFALIPLVISLLGKKDAEADLQERFARSIAAAPAADQQRIRDVLSQGEISVEDALAALPGGKLDGAHLARNTSAHWVYAAIAATGFLLLLGLMFSVERANPLHLLGIGAFTGTVGIIFLLLVQACASFKFGTIRGRGLVILLVVILVFIGWSYNSANDPESNFLLSALGFTFGVGLCEEFSKAIPLFFYFKRDARMGWRGACLWGLASGIGFGVSEGIMYSARYYNGLSGVDIYLVRFISCVALHAMWSGSVAIAIARNADKYEDVEDLGGFALFMFRVLGVPMVLHGFYDTLLKMDMSGWALGVALLSFGWFAWHVELARGASPDAGRAGVASRRRLAY